MCLWSSSDDDLVPLGPGGAFELRTSSRHGFCLAQLATWKLPLPVKSRDDRHDLREVDCSTGSGGFQTAVVFVLLGNRRSQMASIIPCHAPKKKGAEHHALRLSRLKFDKITISMIIPKRSRLFVCRSTRPLSRTIRPLLRNTGAVYPAREANAFRMR